MTGEAPTGTATVVLGDVAGSTRLWQEHPAVMPGVSRRIAQLVDDLAAAGGGHRPREQGEGDNFVATFAAAADAVTFAVALDQALADESWPEGLHLGMRIGVHTGDVQWDQVIGYLGPTFNRCARLRDLGRARMILLSQTTRDIVMHQLPDGTNLVDLGSHQLRDLSRTEQVHQLRHPGTPDEFPPLKSVTVLPNNLPVPVTSLVGRERDIQDVAGHFGDNRLVTLTGAGGAGKTRLAQHVASELLRFAPDGAWWVDLLPVADDERVPVAIADSAGIADVAPSSQADEIVAAGIGDRRMLLVLDNCEHLIDAVADTVDVLLQRCPNMRVLATSREPLDVLGERAVRVRPLPVPDDQRPALVSLEEHPATSLFLDRATSLDPSGLDAEQRASVARICRRLDGMPLAIELAASRTRVLSLADIESGLDDRFGLLRSGRRGRRAGARQRTLEASIAWSFDLLDDEEEAMLCRLAVMPSLFDLEGAHAVGWPDDRRVALELLTALVDKSLVAVSPAADRRRYRLLESIRHYALNRLHERGAGEAARVAHLHHTLARVTAIADTGDWVLGGAGPVSGVPSSLQDDLRTADATAMATGRHAELVDLYWPLYFTLLFRGTYHEALPSLLEVLEDADDLDLLHRVRAYSLVMAYLATANQQDRVADLAGPSVAAAEDLAERQGHPTELTSVLGTVAYAAAFSGRGDAASTARRCMRLVHDGAETPLDPVAFAIRAPYCGLALSFGGADTEAWPLINEAVRACDEAGLDHLGAVAAIHRSVIALSVGRPAAEVRELLADVADRVPDDTPRLHAQIGSAPGPWLGVLTGNPDVADHWVAHGHAHAGPPGSGSHSLMAVGEVITAHAHGDHDRAIEDGIRTAAALGRTDNRWWQAHALLLVVMSKVVRGDVDVPQAAAAFRSVDPAGRWPMLRSWLDAFEARHEVQSGRPVAALTRVADAVARERQTGTRILGGALQPAAAAFAATDDPKAAARALGALDGLLAATGYVDLHAALTAAAARAARAALGDRRFASHHDAGAAMTNEEVLDWLADAAVAPRRDR